MSAAEICVCPERAATGFSGLAEWGYALRVVAPGAKADRKRTVCVGRPTGRVGTVSKHAA
jgi:hypothetical protein